MIDAPPPFNETWFLLMIGFVSGLLLGSFVTMLSYRLPRKLSIIFPPSSCSLCHTPLKPRDLMPVISWLISRGTCRHCGAKISSRYIFIELATGIASATAFALLGIQPLLAVVLLIIVALTTLATMTIENKKS